MYHLTHEHNYTKLTKSAYNNSLVYYNLAKFSILSRQLKENSYVAFRIDEPKPTGTFIKYREVKCQSEFVKENQRLTKTIEDLKKTRNNETEHLKKLLYEL